VTALELADEYGIKLWIAALLDPEDIAHGNNDASKQITSPPPFNMEDNVNGLGRTPGGTEKKSADGKRSTRGARSLRSESPTATTKPKASARKMATPRKARKPRGTVNSVDETASVAADEPAVTTNGVHKEEDSEAVKIEVETTTVPVTNGATTDEITESTTVRVSVPASHPELAVGPPNDMDEMLQKARDMVAEAERLSRSTTDANSTSPRQSGKRKADEITVEENEVAPVETTKRAKVVEVELRKERVRRRALTGIAGVLALGYVSFFLISSFRVIDVHLLDLLSRASNADLALAVHWSPASWPHSLGHDSTSRVSPFILSDLFKPSCLICLFTFNVTDHPANDFYCQTAAKQNPQRTNIFTPPCLIEYRASRSSKTKDWSRTLSRVEG
jgi:hypothetical protein